MPDHYTYRVSWTEEDAEFVGTCIEFPSLSHLAPTRAAALTGIEALVRDVLADLRQSGEPVPQPIADRHFSGRFVARIPGTLHRRLVMEAMEAGVSLNRYISFKLALPDSVAAPPAAPRRRTKVPAEA